MVKIGGNYVLSGHDVTKLGPAAEGLYVISGYPQWSEAIGTEYDKIYRETIGMDDFGKEKDSDRFLVPSYQWATWESIYTIKEVVEETGWQSMADTPKFITVLEGRKFRLGVAHPEGDKVFRQEDHLTIKGLWIEQIKDAKLTLAERVPAEGTVYPAAIDYLKDEPF